MTRHWHTSTTVLALVLNAASVLPSSAYDSADPVRSIAPSGAELRLAENENNRAAQELMSDVLGDAPVAESGEQGGQVNAAAAVQAQAEAGAADAQATADAAAAEATAAVEANAAAESEAAQAQAEENAAEENEAVRQQSEADAAAEQQAEAAAAQAQADHQAEQALADAEGAAAARAKADAAVQAAAEAEATAAAEAELNAASKAQTGAETAPAQSGENAVPSAIGEVPRSTSTEDTALDVLPEVSAEAQANAAEQGDENAVATAAASGEGEVLNTQQGTISEGQTRSSGEEFETTASGKATAPVVKSKNNDVLKTVGIVAAAGLGAYAVGKLLQGGGEVVSNTGDRAVVREPSGEYRIIKDDDTLLRRPGSSVQTQTYDDGSTRSEVTEADGSSTVTIRAADGRVLRRTRVLGDGRRVTLFDDTRTYARVDVSELENANRAAAARDYDYSTSDVDQLRTALSAANGTVQNRTYSLNQIRRIDAVRHLVPVIALDAINFQTGSAVIGADEAQDLSDLGRAMAATITDDPGQVFLIEGHTDTVGDASYNLALSDRRAESVALALTEYFQVPPANMIVQGYGEADLRIRQAGDIRANRRGAVRNITPLLGGGS